MLEFEVRCHVSKSACKWTHQSFLLFSWKPSSKCHCSSVSEWNKFIKVSINAWLRSHSVPCLCLIVDGLYVFKAFTVRTDINLPIWSRKGENWMLVANDSFYGWEERLLSEIGRKHKVDVGRRWLIVNSIIERPHSLDVLISLGSLHRTGARFTLLFFHYQKCPHNATTEKKNTPEDSDTGGQLL